MENCFAVGKASRFCVCGHRAGCERAPVFVWVNVHKLSVQWLLRHEAGRLESEKVPKTQQKLTPNPLVLGSLFHCPASKGCCQFVMLVQASSCLGLKAS